MNWLITENKKRVNINEIPVLNIGDLRLEIIKLSKRVIGLALLFLLTSLSLFLRGFLM